MKLKNVHDKLNIGIALIEGMEFFAEYIHGCWFITAREVEDTLKEAKEITKK